MALTFPGSPAIDDQTTTGGRTYRWTGYAWDLVGSGIAGPTGPAGSGTPVVIAVGTGSGDQPTNLALGGNVYDITFNGTGVVANPTGTHTDGQQILWRITRTAAEAVTLGTEFAIVSGSINDATNYRTFVRATYSATETKWFAEVTNVEVIPPVAAALLLHCDGSDGGVSFTDSSTYARSITVGGSATTSVTQSKFGGASASFDGSSGYLEATMDDSDWDADFTVEFFLMLNSLGSYQGVFTAGAPQSGQGGLLFYLDPSGVPNVNNCYSEGLVGQALTTGVWYHFALVRVAGTDYGWIDGVAMNPIGSAAQNYNVVSPDVTFGGAPGFGWFFSGYLDEIRIVKGFGVYTGAFSPPTSPLTDPV